MEVSYKPAHCTLSSTRTTCFSDGKIQLIKVQVLIRSGIPRFDIIGLPQSMIREGKDRILSSLSSLGIELPAQKVLVSLIPGDLPKEGTHFDLPILAGILAALGLLARHDEQCFYWGEVGLDGSVQPLNDPLAHILYANQFNPSDLITGLGKIDFSFVDQFLKTHPKGIKHVQEILLEATPPANNYASAPVMRTDEAVELAIHDLWIKEIPADSRWNSLRGSPEQFLFWILVMLGRHHILLEGSPGVGKSSWCLAVDELQLPLTRHRLAERLRHHSFVSSRIRKVSDLFSPPFEAPHHSSSRAAIVGGGSGAIEVGALSRSEGGILFLDEFNEFSRDVLESLREPLETKSITIARRGIAEQLPADIQLLCAMNPCKCGNFRSKKLCTCTTNEFQRYQTRISGPLKDRFHACCWWEFIEEKIPKEFHLQKLRTRIVECNRNRKPNLGQILPPLRLKPRRQKRWLEFFGSWCKWFGISDPENRDADEFNNFLKRIEDANG